MKRVLALALALVLSLSMSVIAFADDTNLVFDGTVAKDTYKYLAPDKSEKILMQVEDGNGVVVLGAKNVAQALDDNYLKVSFKPITGSEYVKSATFKKNTDGELYCEIKMVDLYIGKTPDVKFEIKLTFTKPAKIGEKLFEQAYRSNLTAIDPVTTHTAASAWAGNGYEVEPAANKLTATSAVITVYEGYFGNYKWDTATKKYMYVNDSSAGSIKNNDFVLREYNNYKFGWDEIKKIAGDYTYTGTDADKPIVHLKDGENEVSSFDFPNAYFEARFSKQPEINLWYSEAAIKEITSKYQDVDFQFFNWKGKPVLDFTANLELYVDEDEVGEAPVLYFYDGANLVKLSDATYEDATFYLKRRELGAFVVASKELPANASAAPVETTAGATQAAGTGNPKTGVSDFVGVAVALAVVSMAAAGAVALKK